MVISHKMKNPLQCAAGLAFDGFLLSVIYMNIQVVSGA